MNKKLFFTIPFILSLLLLYGCKCGGKVGLKGEINPFDPITVDLTKVGETDTPLKMSQFAESVSYIYLSEEP
ncbi:MAG: hypothetical protein LBG28_07710, partial [Tannerella sp.]|nr:hypothetical protein [Tannerella sp.]